MFRILVPLDGSLLADWAIAWADELAGALEAEVELIRVVGRSLNPINTEWPGLRYAEEETDIAGEALTKAARRLRRARRVQTQVLTGDPGEKIAERARTALADLIVMVTRGRSGLPRALLGSIAATVVRESGVPVLLLRADLAAAAPRRFRCVLVPLDGSDLAGCVVPAIAPLARELHWTLVLLGAVEQPTEAVPMPGGVIPPDQLLVDQRAGMTAYLERVAAAVRAESITAQTSMRVGAAASSILDFAHGHKMDLVAMSTHSREGLERLTEGSVTDEVLLCAPVPVLAVHPRRVPPASPLAAWFLEAEPTNREGEVDAALARAEMQHRVWSACCGRNGAEGLHASGPAN